MQSNLNYAIYLRGRERDRDLDREPLRFFVLGFLLLERDWRFLPAPPCALLV